MMTEPKTNTRNRLASFEIVIKTVEHRRRQDELEDPGETGCFTEGVDQKEPWGRGMGKGSVERQKKLS